MLKPLDLVAGLEAHLWPVADPWSYERLATALGASPSQVHTSLKRLEAGGLYRAADRSLRVHAFLRFAIHGVPVVFPAHVGDVAVGMPIAHAAPPLSDCLVYSEPYVWPTGSGVAGRAVLPLHPGAPHAAAGDPALYQALALLDALRVGRARDRRLAAEHLERLLSEPGRDALWLAAGRARHAS
jgi:hypothetical protein